MNFYRIHEYNCGKDEENSDETTSHNIDNGIYSGNGSVVEDYMVATTV
jgi:hypothetical protein